MPRANRRRRDEMPLSLGRARGGVVQQESYAGHLWSVRRVTGEGSERAYLCPGCQQQIPPGVAHAVVWPAEGVGGVGDRRHWHAACWQARHTRHTSGSIR